MISSIETGGTVDQRQLETVPLNFAEFRITYTPQDRDGSPLPEVGPIGWNIPRAEAV